MHITKHEGVIFQNQTVYIAGQAFVRCSFVACTLVLRETMHHLENCTFERCNWHIDCLLMWGNPDTLRQVKTLIAMIESGQAGSDSTDPGRLPPQNIPPAGGA